MAEKWECIGFEFPQKDEEYPDSVVKVIMDMRVSPARISKKEADNISAAPELLEACEKVLELFDTGPVTATEVVARRGGVYDTIRAAIAKAKGDDLPRLQEEAAP